MNSEIARRRIKVVGVTFNNDDGESRQAILCDIADSYGDAMFLVDAELQRYEYQTAPAYHVLIDNRIVGNLSAELAREVALLEDSGYYIWVEDPEIVGGTEPEEEWEDPLNYGVRITLCIASSEAIKEESERIAARQAEKSNSHNYKVCPHCGARIVSEAVMCPSCKVMLRPLPKEKKKSRGIWKLILGGIYLLYGLMWFGRDTRYMFFSVLIGGALIFWWFAKNWEPKKKDK